MNADLVLVDRPQCRALEVCLGDFGQGLERDEIGGLKSINVEILLTGNKLESCFISTNTLFPIKSELMSIEGLGENKLESTEVVVIVC